jgi:diguanylate cyclase (GGDEF)-like protein
MLDSLEPTGPLEADSFRRLVLMLAAPCDNADGIEERRLKRLLLAFFRALNDHDMLEYEHLLQIIDREIPFHGVTLFQALGQSTDLSVVYRNGPVVDLLDRFGFGGGAGFSSWVARHKKQILLTNIHTNPEHSKSYVRSFVSVALPHRGRTIGVLNLSHTLSDAFDESDLALLKNAAAPIGAILVRLRKKQRRVGTLAHDNLTGLLDSRSIERYLREEFHHSRRHQLPLAVAVVAVHGIDAVCEQVGQHEAERALAEVGRVIRRHLTADQRAGRGNDHSFVVVLPRLAGNDARRLVECCAQAVSLVPIDRGPALSACAGIAEARPEDQTFSSLIERATDAAKLGRRESAVVTV